MPYRLQGQGCASKLNAPQIVKTVNDENFAMAALVMQVNGFCFKGNVYIALDEGADYYRIYGEQNSRVGLDYQSNI